MAVISEDRAACPSGCADKAGASSERARTSHSLARTTRRFVLCAVLVPIALAAQSRETPPRVLPASAVAQLARSLAQSRAHPEHAWRHTPALNPDGTVNAYVEISRGDRRKWEFDMRSNARALDRVIPASGGFPVNYGFVPQTVSYDGDPFDALVLGPPLPAGRFIRGVIVGTMFMEDEKGSDSKVVLSVAGPGNRPHVHLTAERQAELAAFFSTYKQHEPGAFSRVPGWGSIADGLALITTTHAFFSQCAARAAAACELQQ